VKNFLAPLPTFLKPRPTFLNPFLIPLPTLPAALKGFNLPNNPPKNAATRLQKNNAAINGLLTDDEQEDAILDIIKMGIILAAIFVPLLYSTEKKVYKSIGHN
tara:strand:+ start:267 stop:575 length:309 start_codon:yes stop_codon:yes gene_type:complete